ncbi:hypothetical protein ACJIZ3_017712 [Penstemon smallii]|uniref:Uncharacterized protein n=1 Tax=Penstemon smallii TaxID=265156 RepID=A0ABD3SX40_9LAMI
MEGEADKRRRVNLLCPSVSSKIVQIIAWEDQKLDLGSIARVFGLDPNTLKLNGHFISRGVDLIASSVTWKSLIGFFSSRGLSTGASDSDALLVHGKLSKIGSKRSHDPTGNGISEMSQQEKGYIRNAKKKQLEHGNLLNNDKFKETNSGSDDINLKRKLCFRGAINFKRSRYDEADSGLREINCGTSTESKFPCSFKRMRDEEMVSTAPLKRTR